MRLVLAFLALFSLTAAQAQSPVLPGPGLTVASGGGGGITFNWSNGSNTTANGAIGGFTVGSTNPATTNGTINLNDVLIACIDAEATAANDPGTISLTGFTQIQQQFGASQDPLPRRIYCGYKVAGASEPGTYAATWANGSTVTNGASWILMDYSAVNTSTPVDVSGFNTNTSFASANMPCASVTTTVSNDVLICAWMPRGGNGAYTVAATTTLRFNVTSTVSSVPEILIGDKAIATAGATGTLNATQGAAESSMSITIALHP